MAFLLKEVIKTKDLDELNTIKSEFSTNEKEFEIIKQLVVSNHKENLIDFFIKKIYLNPIIKHNLSMLFKNEKLLEKSFDKTVTLQKVKFILVSVHP